MRVRVTLLQTFVLTVRYCTRPDSWVVVGVSMLLGSSASSPSLTSLLAHLAQERDTQVRVLLGYLTEICFHVSKSPDAVSL